MTVRDLLSSLRKHLLIVALVTVLTTAAVGTLSMLSTPVYRSASSVYFSLDLGLSASDLNQGSVYTQNQMLSFAQLATTPVVLQPVIDSLGLDMSAKELSRIVTASRPQDTAFLDIAATSGSPETAAAIANAVALELSRTVEEYAPRDSEGKTTTRVRVVEEAQPPLYPIAPNTKRNVAAAFVVGLLAGMLIAYLRDVLDTRVRRPEDVASVLDVPVLAQISAVAGGKAKRSLVVGDLRAEEYRRLRTNLRFLSVDTEGLCLVFSSAMPGEGKTTTSINLAVALAEADLRVLLVDADMRRPRVAENTGLEGNAGLTTVLIGRTNVDDVIQRWGDVDVLTAGEIPPNPSELVATRALRELLDSLRSRYDVILLDAPPLLPVTDAAILSRMATGMIIVANAKKLRRAQLREVVDGVNKAGGHVLGIVLNRVKARRVPAYGYSTQSLGVQAPMERGGEVVGGVVDSRSLSSRFFPELDELGEFPVEPVEDTPTERSLDPVRRYVVAQHGEPHRDASSAARDSARHAVQGDAVELVEDDGEFVRDVTAAVPTPEEDTSAPDERAPEPDVDIDDGDDTDSDDTDADVDRGFEITTSA